LEKLRRDKILVAILFETLEEGGILESKNAAMVRVFTPGTTAILVLNSSCNFARSVYGCYSDSHP